MMKYEDGKYVILKDPMKGILRIYKVPSNSFEGDDDDADENDQEEALFDSWETCPYGVEVESK